MLNTIADGLRLSVLAKKPFPIIEKYLHEIILVEDRHIVGGMRALAKDAKLVAETARHWPDGEDRWWIEEALAVDRRAAGNGHKSG